MHRFMQHPLAWLAGFLLSVNVYVVPPLAASPRATDVIGLGLGMWVLLRLAQGRQPLGPLTLLAVAALLPLAWTALGLLDADIATTLQAARWLVALPWGLALPVLLRDDARRRRFAWGVVWGGFANVLVVQLQAIGLEPYLRLTGLSSTTAAFHHYVGQVVRLPGLHGHHNATSTVVSLVVPAVLYLYFRHRCSVAAVLASLAAFLLVLHLTSTRGPLLVAPLTIGYAFLAARAMTRGLLIGIVLASLSAGLILAYGPPGGWSRWQDTQGIQVNAGERLDSMQGALGLTVDHPLGLGVTRGKEQLYDHSGHQATHNAFLQVALFLGLPLGLLILVALPVATMRGLAGRDGPLFLEGLLACHLIGLFLFEEHLNNPTFVILTMWLVVAAFGRLRQRHGGAAIPVAAPVTDP